MKTLEWTEDRLEGTFGDRKVLLYTAPPSPSSPLVMFLHGVHGCADMEEGNKYRALAELLYQQDIASCLVESSRKRRDRIAFGEDYPAWAQGAFEGKSYAQDLGDFARALAFLQEKFSNLDFWLWGFSLGGIHATLLASPVYRRVLEKEGLESPAIRSNSLKGVLLSGTGHYLRPEQALLLRAPILDSLPPNSLLLEAAESLECEKLYSFYGSLDNTFSEQSCRELFERAPRKVRQKFTVIPGADHAFRNLEGVPSLEPLRQMTERIIPGLR
ncbi:MAG TPA: alpha/beta hydrolase [Synergistaceae bacterium]|nr:alpha/beta hydrolase [Synergistaceae bacterium]HPJ25998.1 alpha/beta hydrolase [Synergistaceae bacterium]HPQ37306.1 alpha/beta hydrolase [Synergistaceae bacterium]